MILCDKCKKDITKEGHYNCDGHAWCVKCWPTTEIPRVADESKQPMENPTQ